jgi:hypothetical protein
MIYLLFFGSFCQWNGHVKCATALSLTKGKWKPARCKYGKQVYRHANISLRNIKIVHNLVFSLAHNVQYVYIHSFINVQKFNFKRCNV